MSEVEDTGGSNRCNAKRTKRGDRCRMWAGAGTSHPGIGVCAWHGGATRNHVTRANRIMAARAVTELGLPLDIDPATALLNAVGEAAGNVAWLRNKVNECEDVAWETPQAGRVSVWLELYNSERDRLTKISSAAVGAGVALATVRIAQSQAQALVTALTASLAELGLDPGSEAVRAVLGRQLRLVAGEGALEA